MAIGHSHLNFKWWLHLTLSAGSYFCIYLHIFWTPVYEWLVTSYILILWTVAANRKWIIYECLQRFAVETICDDKFIIIFYIIYALCGYIGTCDAECRVLTPVRIWCGVRVNDDIVSRYVVWCGMSSTLRVLHAPLSIQIICLKVEVDVRYSIYLLHMCHSWVMCCVIFKYIRIGKYIIC